MLLFEYIFHFLFCKASSLDAVEDSSVTELPMCLCLLLLSQSCPTLCDPMDCSPPGFSVLGASSARNTGIGCYALLQRIFPAQGSNPGLPHCRQILCWLNHQGSPRTLGWVAYTFSRGSSWLRNGMRVSSLAGGWIFLRAELPGKPRLPIGVLNSLFSKF